MKDLEIKLGIYKHFKGLICKVIGIAKNSEDYSQEFVIYEHADKDGKTQLWARPRDMFTEEIERDGKKFKRFEYIRE